MQKKTKKEPLRGGCMRRMSPFSILYRRPYLIDCVPCDLVLQRNNDPSPHSKTRPTIGWSVLLSHGQTTG